jgi:hypothetical protein
MEMADGNTYMKLEGDAIYSIAALEEFVFDALNGKVEAKVASVSWWRWVTRIISGMFSWKFISENPLLVTFIFFGIIVLIILCIFDYAIEDLEEAEAIEAEKEKED